MKKTVLLLIVILACVTVGALTDVPAGSVNGTWTITGSPYRIQDDINVPYGDSLVIEPGVVVDFEGHYRMNVYGVLQAVGAPGDSIRFTRVTNDPAMLPDTAGLADTSNFAGAWGGIEFDTYYSSVSNLRYCIFEFINTIDNAATSEDDLLAPVHFRGDGQLYMSQSAVRNNYGTHCGGIWAGNTVYLDSCLIRDNIAYGSESFSISSAGGLLIRYSENTEITNNAIINNKSYGHSAAGGIKIYAGSPLIMNNFISNNRSYRENTVSGGGMLCISSYPRIIQNLVVNNECGSAGGIYYQWGGGNLYNNTICNNKSIRWDGAGVFFEGASGVIATNNIFYGNTGQAGLTQIWLSSISSQPVVRYNLIGSGMEEVNGSDNGAIKESENLFGDPSFINPTGFDGNGLLSSPEDWHLLASSTLINKGHVDPVNEFSIEKDMAGYRRINYGHVDPGCFEFRLESYTPAATISSPEIWIADTVHITKETDLNAKVTIYPGVVILSDGNHTINAWDTLYAIGTTDAPILFTINDTSGFSDIDSEAGGWGTINAGGAYPRVFKDCIFEFAKINRPISSDRGLITGFSNGNVVVENCVFRNCFMIHASLVYTFSGSNYSVNSCTFYNNKVTSTAGIIFLAGSNFTVKGNLIFNNDCEQRIVSLDGANMDFVNNSIYHNNGSLNFVKCFNLNIANNTIVNNSSGASMWTGDNAKIINSIIPDFNISQEGYQIISSYVPANLCSEDKCTDLLTGAPVFNNPLPYSGTGPLEEILQADYSLANISPGIDSGAIDTVGLKLGSLDVSGNPRINNGRIDIGAYENQGSLPVITSQPAGGTFCLGDNHILVVEQEGSDTVNFKWFKDGTYVSGQDKDNSLELDSIEPGNEGNYHCEISNSYGTVLSTPVFIKVNVRPEILIQPENLWHESGKPLSLSVVYTGSSPITFQWKKDGVVIPGEDLPEYRFTPVDSASEGNHICTISNMCGTVNTDPVALYLAPQICMVTVSPTTGHNLVVWEKKSKAPILAYNIYRESVAAGIYDRLATVPFDDLSVLVDTIADPTVQAYLYKITAIDTAENETDIDLCNPHKTIHLIVSTNPELNTTQLQWDRYYGFDYQTYTIYKSSTGVNFDAVHSLSASLNSWTDPDPSEGELYYRIAVEKPDPCIPEGGNKKAGTGPYHHSLSNMDDNKLQLGENPPDSIMLDNHSVDENKLPGNLVGRLTSRDLDTVDYHTYHLVSGEGDDDNLSFSLIGDLLITAVTFDYETKNTYSVRIRSTDNSAIYTENTFTININDTEETEGGSGASAPDSLMLSNQTIYENNLIGDLIGRLTTRDPDTFDIHSYQLVQGSGDDDNLKFMILGDMLMAAHRFDFEDNDQYTIRVRSTDLGDNHIENVFIVNIIDLDETVGIIQTEIKTLRIYPNPFNQSTTISFPNPEGKLYRMVLTDLSGKVYRIMDDITTSEYVLKKGDLKEGFYFMELRGTQTYRGKIIIE